MRSTTSLVLLLASLTAARKIPANLKMFYDTRKTGPCPNPISIRYDSGQAVGDTEYCKDNSTGVLYLKDTGNGYADVDIDCDGLNSDKDDCFNDPSGQPQTAFKTQVQQFDIEDLDSHIHTFVVLGNDNSIYEGDGGEAFDPQNVGIQPLSVVAVVCGENLFYGVWGDVNGGKLTGETSLSLGQMCFPNEPISGNYGHTAHDVLFVAFEGDEAVPGATANWKAKTRVEFEASLAPLGDKLVAKIGSKPYSKTKGRVMRVKV